ncbi:MAG: PEP-CTERM sorting domain-containing protein [Planctomycetota bacterium]
MRKPSVLWAVAVGGASVAGASVSEASVVGPVTLDFSDPSASVFTTFDPATDSGPVTTVQPVGVPPVANITLTGSATNTDAGQLVVDGGALGIQSNVTGNPDDNFNAGDELVFSFDQAGTLLGLDFDSLGAESTSSSSFGAPDSLEGFEFTDNNGNVTLFISDFFGAAGPQNIFGSPVFTPTDGNDAISLDIDFEAGDEFRLSGFSTGSGFPTVDLSVELEAITFVIPEPGVGGLLGVLGAMVLSRRRRAAHH